VTDVFEKIEGISGVAARENELLSLHTTFGVGGPCRLMVWVSDKQALKQVLAAARAEGIAVFVLGKGSNVLVKDGGLDGIVIRLVDEFTSVEVSGAAVRAGAGASLAEVVSKATSSGVGGLEFLAGIPGTVGGAAVANAGAKDVWFGHRLAEIAMISDDLREIRVGPGDLGFGYRTSGIRPGWVVTEAVLEGRSTSVEEARRQVENYLEGRRSSQPIGERSAGCIFKNPAGTSAGRLIDQAGLKGESVGRAQVSPIHANFVINTGGATAREILDLVDTVRRRVEAVHAVRLEMEISVIGKD
jgi:UDP-N-acetylmuramate dehydrogenase